MTSREDELVVWKLWSPKTSVHVADVERSVTVTETAFTREGAHLDSVEVFAFNMAVDW